MPKFMKVTTTDELEDEQAKLVEVEGQKIALFRVGEVLRTERYVHASRRAAVRRDGRGSRSDLPLALGRFDIKSGAVPGGAGGTRGQELPGAGHWRRRRDRGVKQRIIPVCMPLRVRLPDGRGGGAGGRLSNDRTLALGDRGGVSYGRAPSAAART